MDSLPVLGIDIGSVSISAALVGPNGHLIRSSHDTHNGEVRQTLERIVGEVAPGLIRGLGVTGSSPRLLSAGRRVDDQVCLITACRLLFPRAGSILWTGGERFGLIRLDDRGGYMGTRTNTSCAAGTGSFLDQQARRLGLADAAELAALALRSAGVPPRISTRCAVFARTDLVHAQQAGYSLEEICAGLCAGVARNIVDTVLAGFPPGSPVAFAGGVSANQAVRRELETLFGVPVVTHELSPVMGALGAALDLLVDGAAADDREPPMDLRCGIERLFRIDRTDQQTYYPPLSPPAAGPSDRTSVANPSYLHTTGRFATLHPVEVDVYGEMTRDLWLGVDVGSTSTKAMVTDGAGRPLVGLYGRTLGRPVTASQALLAALDTRIQACGVNPRFLGLATTGAGRKLVGGILGADLVVDEITAHARAAVADFPDVDTIIEIGGQDAKFTTLRDGRVTFAHMNTVCAAGTGSFLEEQAQRLGCDLSEYAAIAWGVRAPLVSDRCAVFMERDINDLLARGFGTPQILAACLFAVRENYMTKVARGEAIGRHICFQGATARNQALVAAFEQGLGQPVHVSPYCHLTGALGAALLAREEAARDASRPTAFRGLDAVLAHEIPIRGETCDLCTNHCRLRTAQVAGQTLAYGFLCGRDYDTHRYVSANRSGFDPLQERKSAHAATPQADLPLRTSKTIGIPAALSLYEELPLWKRFFAELRIPVVTTEDLRDTVRRGRNLQGAEFCTPITALHGHAAHLGGRADYVFLPIHLVRREDADQEERCYCYYTQYAPSLVSALEGLRGRCLMPLSDSPREIHRALESADIPLDLEEVQTALSHAQDALGEAQSRLRARFRTEMSAAREPCVLLLGRPYTILSPELNKGIPAIFAAQGVKVFTQDMVERGSRPPTELEPLLRTVHWHYAARILEAALVAADTPLLYPVFVTSFKCSPDSIAVEYFRRILDRKGKPYLVLQLDDHDSSMGYETRIEAGVRAFRNHAAAAHEPAPRAQPVPVPRVDRKLDGRTLLLPAWDNLVIPLVAASLQREGVDARVLEEDPLVIRASMRHNTGQCLPLSAIAQETMDYVERYGLDPARTALWMPRGVIACNFPQFPAFIQSLFQTRGRGLERIGVYRGEYSLVDLGPRAALRGYRAALVGGLLRRTGCRLRPYEVQPGATDRALERALEILVPAFAQGVGLRDCVRQAADLFAQVATVPGRKPKVAIFGDVYVRDNDVMSQGLIHSIEEAGGEVVCTTLVEYWRIVIGAYYRRWRAMRDYHNLLVTSAAWTMMENTGRAYTRPFERWLGPPRTPVHVSHTRILRQFGVRPEHAGESFDNLLKVFHLWREHPDLRLFVQANPAFCCPSLVTEAMTGDIRRATGIPVVSLTYDGTGTYRNDAIVPYLRYARDLEASPGLSSTTAGRLPRASV